MFAYPEVYLYNNQYYNLDSGEVGELELVSLEVQLPPVHTCALPPLQGPRQALGSGYRYEPYFRSNW